MNEPNSEHIIAEAEAQKLREAALTARELLATARTNVFTGDHDLIIELRTEVRGLRNDFKSMADDTKARLILIEASKLDKEDFKMHLGEDAASHIDHEKRIRGLEKYFWVGLGIVIAMQFIAPIVVKYWIH